MVCLCVEFFEKKSILFLIFILFLSYFLHFHFLNFFSYFILLFLFIHFFIFFHFLIFDFFLVFWFFKFYDFLIFRFFGSMLPQYMALSVCLFCLFVKNFICLNDQAYNCLIHFYSMLIWKMTFDGTRPLMEDDLCWKMIFDGRHLLMEDIL